MGGLLIAGTTSDAGKSLVATGLCRALSRKGLAVAPYKAQNMSNNSMVIEGGEIGRAQWLQARAANITPTVDMNPVLLKPASDRRSHIVLRGQPAGTLEAGQYATGRRELAEAAWAAYEDLSARHDVVVCEGAGSPAEINLRAGDYTNMGLASRFDLPVALVADIDRGGMLASVYGTWALMPTGDRGLLRGYLVNKFRGDASLLEPGLEILTNRTGLTRLGVLPWLDGVDLDSEDNLQLTPVSGSAASRSTADRNGDNLGFAPTGARDKLQIAVLRLPRVSNSTDIDALAAEPGVELVVTTSPHMLTAADLVVVPGSRTTIADLEWLRASGLGRELLQRAATGLPILGICGGYQVLAGPIFDPHGVESTQKQSHGLGLLPASTTFQRDKTLGLVQGQWQGHSVSGYEIHHGTVRRDDRAHPFLDGAQQGAVYGTMWHGTMESDAFRRAFLGSIAHQTGSGWRPYAATPTYERRRETMINTLADAVEEHAPGLLTLAMSRVTR